MARLKKSHHHEKPRTSTWVGEAMFHNHTLSGRSDKGRNEYSNQGKEESDEELSSNCDDLLAGIGDSESPTDDVVSLDEPTGDKRKVAPRSGLQFKIGPSFETTTLFRPIFISSTNENVFPFVKARIDRGFDFINNEWIGYKRNYFTLVAAFEFENMSPQVLSREKFHTVDNYNLKKNINFFAIRLTSKCCEDDMQISLVQHTAKRDRGPQFEPPVYPQIPGTLPSHSVIKQAANIRNEEKIDQFNKLFFYDDEPYTEISKNSILNTYPEKKAAKVARYERIQFSTSINYRKPAMVNRHFTLQVELLGFLDDESYLILASTETPPLIVRGRSPSNYQLAKRNAKALLENKNLENYKQGNNNNLFSILSTEGPSLEKLDYVSNRAQHQTPISRKTAIPIEKRANRMTPTDEISLNGEDTSSFEKSKNELKEQNIPKNLKRRNPSYGSLREIDLNLSTVDQEDNEKLSESWNDENLTILNKLDYQDPSLEFLSSVLENKPSYMNLDIRNSVEQASLSPGYFMEGFMSPSVRMSRSKKNKSKVSTSRRSKKEKHRKKRPRSSNNDETFLKLQEGLRKMETECDLEDQSEYISEYII